jgi:hypothetical protein
MHIYFPIVTSKHPAGVNKKPGGEIRNIEEFIADSEMLILENLNLRAGNARG